MTSLYGRMPSTTYPELLKLNHNNAGLDTTLRTVEDGEGVASPLKLSINQIALHDQIWPSIGAVFGKILKVGPTTNTLVWGTLTSDDLGEGSTNLFYSNARAAASAPVQTVFGRTNNVVLLASDVVSALNYVPQTTTMKNMPNGYAGLNSLGQVSLTQIPVIPVTDGGTY